MCGTMRSLALLVVISLAVAASSSDEQPRPIVVVSHRRVPTDKMDAFKVAHKAAVDYFFEHVPGVKAAFFSIDKDEPTLVHDFQWFNNIDSFLAHGDLTNPVTKQKVMDWTSLYDPAYPMTGDVYGNWNDQVKTMTAGFGAKFDFHTSLNGFIKTTAEGLAGPPVIVSSQRRVQAGKLEELTAKMQDAAMYYRENIPGVLAITMAVDSKDPLLVHDLQVFANMDAFNAHSNMQNPEIAKLVMAWTSLYDPASPMTGEVWSTDGTKVDEKTSGFGAKFAFYDYPVIGKVDLMRSDSGPAAECPKDWKSNLKDSCPLDRLQAEIEKGSDLTGRVTAMSDELCSASCMAKVSEVVERCQGQDDGDLRILRAFRVCDDSGTEGGGTDWSDLSWTGALIKLLDYMKKVYPYTVHRGIDWEVLGARYHPRIRKAEESGDNAAYLRALRDLVVDLHDGHVSAEWDDSDGGTCASDPTAAAKAADIGAGFGVDFLRDDQRNIVVAYTANPHQLKIGDVVSEVPECRQLILRTGRPVSQTGVNVFF